MKTIQMGIKLGLSILAFGLLFSLTNSPGPVQAQPVGASGEISRPLNDQATLSDPYLLFADNFDDGNADGWTTSMSGTWTVDNYEYVVDMGAGQNLLGISTAGDTSWQDYVLKLDLRGEAGADKSFGFRVNETGDYWINIVGDPGNHVLLGHNGDVLVNQYYPNGNVVWYHVVVSVLGPRSRVYINDNLIINHADETQAGYIELVGWTGAFGSDIVRYDNVEVRAIKPIYLPYMTKP
jgi:hypothetical protein